MKRKITTVLLMSLIMAFSFLMPSYASTQTFEQPQEEYLNAFLRERGVPYDVIDTMTLGQKLFIYEDLKNETNANFSFFFEEDVSFDNDKRGIPKTDLSLTATGFTMITNNELLYIIYPTFKWLKHSVNINNDRFAFNLNERNWEIAAGNVQINIHGRTMAGHTTTGLIDRPTTILPGGATFNLICGVSAGVTYEGYAVFRARPRVANPPYEIVLAYAHDRSIFNNSSISLNVGILSLSFSGGSNVIQTSQILRWR